MGPSAAVALGEVTRIAPIVLMSLLAGCATPGVSADQGTGQDAAPVVVDVAVPDVADVTDVQSPPLPSPLVVDLPPFGVAPGDRPTRCVRVRLPNETAWPAGGIRTDLGVLGHHAIVSLSDETSERPSGKACPMFGRIYGVGATPIFISLRSKDSMSYPVGSGLVLPPHAMVEVEAHYFNTTGSAGTAGGSVSFDPPPSAVATPSVGLFMAMAIETWIPPGPFVDEWHEIALPGPGALFRLDAHIHRYGTGLEMRLVTRPGDPGTPVYPGAADGQPFRWDQMRTVAIDPPLTVPAGAVLQFRCLWNNPTSAAVDLGPGGEMCKVWGYLTPSGGYRFCEITPPGAASPDGFCCPGDPECLTPVEGQDR